jgi:hypothetical protein
VTAPAVRLREWRFQKGPLCLERGIKKVYEDPRRAFGPRWKDIQNWLEFLGRLLMPKERELTAPAQLSVERLISLPFMKCCRLVTAIEVKHPACHG